VLPFTGLIFPEGLAVDGAGNLYVTDTGNNRVLKLAAGSSSPTVLPFTGLNKPFGVAVDAAGNLYVTDTHKSRVVKLAAG
jgi:serine/threonine protein kinase, bacterial